MPGVVRSSGPPPHGGLHQDSATTTVHDGHTWTLRLPGDGGRGPRVAVKDAIDLAGTVTTAGCVAVRDRGVMAGADAACLAGIRAGRAVIVGKTALTELCLSPTGINDAMGTPVNPLDPDRVPGGSSSGSAVAVATGEADVALGTDTGGSVRIPAACCGVVGLKTTWGRIPLAGVWPLAPSLDTVGPLARDVAGVSAAMALLEPGWAPARAPARTVGRLRAPGVDPALEDAVDHALRAAGLTVHSVQISGWDASFVAFRTIILAEFWQAHHALVDAPGVSASISRGLRAGQGVGVEELRQAYAAQARWRGEVTDLFSTVDLLALPTLVALAPRRAEVRDVPLTELTAPFNLAGLPALALPVPAAGLPLPASLQLVGPAGGEELLCATGQVVADALG